MVSEKDRAHFRAIAEAEHAANREAIRRCARRTPGENIEAGLELSAFAMSFGGRVDHPDEISPAEVWRALEGRRSRPR